MRALSPSLPLLLVAAPAAAAAPAAPDSDSQFRPS